tara:strand:- start:484 stop:702 length:219 start_codon:yes stop_codon:yes gene_type:complete
MKESVDRVSTEYGEGFVVSENDSHYWIMLDNPIKFSDQLLNSIPIKKDKVSIVSNNKNSYETDNDSDYIGIL